jgi:hypothetical protein
MIFQDESNDIILYIRNPYILVYSSGKSCVSKTSIKNSTPYILGWREYKKEESKIDSPQENIAKKRRISLLVCIQISVNSCVTTEQGTCT